ncbi:MAG: type II toxin-antitoxin system VapC family toxin [Bacteroidetes bacterium]|nr:type II toxin-antitoxin system VapC family toxin [Bacteroidota bacterium]MBL7104553.1 type II toxin-antitoxin system VapC family toxin [Bacteroidales bacterium]
MNIIIDTHALIWYIEGEKRLSKTAISAIENLNNQVFVSKASLWELAIKISLGKLKISIGFDDLKKFLLENGFSILDYNFDHLITLLSLQYHHRDPFDRLIIAQSIYNRFNIVTIDKNFRKYDVKIIW